MDASKYYGVPFFCTAITKLSSQMFTMQNSDKCKNFEIRTAECMQAYGWHNGREKCRLLLEDLHECTFQIKRNKRLSIMLRERKRQMKKGQREYIELPRLDLI